MKRLFKLFVILGLVGAGIAVAMRYLNSRRAAEPAAFEPSTPPAPPMAEETLAPEEFVSIVDEPVSHEVVEEIAAPDVPEAEMEPSGVAEPAPVHHDAALDFVPDDGSTPSVEEVEEGSEMVVELVEPEAVPSTFNAEHLTPDEEFQLAEAESGSESTEEVEHGAEMTVEVVEPEPEPAEEPASAEIEQTQPEAAAEVERGAELTHELLGQDVAAPTELAAPGAEAAEIAPEDVLATERDEGVPVPVEEVAPTEGSEAAEGAQPDDFLTRAFLELAATPEMEAAPAESAAEPAPAQPIAPPVEVEAPEAAAPAVAAEPSEPVDAIPESSSADWIPAEEKAFEPLSTGVANAPDLALADTLEEAIGDLTPGAITPRPARNAESFLDEGNVYFNVGQYALAIERYTRAIELDDTLTAAHYNRANARTRAGEFDGALTDYDRALQLAPNDADALNNRGMLHLYRQNYAAALRDFNAALAEDPADTTVMVNRGLAHLHGGDPIRAVEDFREATSLDPGDAAAHYGAAQADAALGRRDDALRSIERALAIDPGYAREAAADPRLGILQGDEQFMRLLRESGSRTS